MTVNEEYIDPSMLAQIKEEMESVDKQTEKTKDDKSVKVRTTVMLSKDLKDFMRRGGFKYAVVIDIALREYLRRYGFK